MQVCFSGTNMEVLAFCPNVSYFQSELYPFYRPVIAVSEAVDVEWQKEALRG